MSNPDALPQDSIVAVLSRYLRIVPEVWTEFNPSRLSELEERAVELLTTAGMIERRVTLRLRMISYPVAVEATITMTGETGLAQAMQFVLADIWNDWRESFEQRVDAPSSHCERIGDEQWRLTCEGVTARNDLDAGNAAAVFDFVLRRGFFDGQPRLLADGRISQRLPVTGRGALERMRRVSGDSVPTSVNIANWEAGGQAFAAAFAELLKEKHAVQVPASTSAAGHSSFALLRVLTNGIVDERIEKAAQVLTDDTLTAHEKLTKIDGLMPLPPTASAEQLGAMLGVSKQAVMKTVWWCRNRRGMTDEEIDRRQARLTDRGRKYECPRSEEDNDER